MASVGPVSSPTVCALPSIVPRPLPLSLVSQLAVESTVGVYIRGGAGSTVWARFFADDPVTRTSLHGCRLRCSGRMYSFVHKSVPEYFAACAMWADVLALAHAIKAATTRARGMCDQVWPVDAVTGCMCRCVCGACRIQGCVALSDAVVWCVL